jgi:hypothetical protein
VSDDDIIEINVGGENINAKRGTLFQIKGTRLEALFSGRWDKKLLRDSSGRIFLNVNGFHRKMSAWIIQPVTRRTNIFCSIRWDYSLTTQWQSLIATLSIPTISSIFEID